MMQVMTMKAKTEIVKSAMLAVQRYPWEQGVCAQALWELGDTDAAVAMAHDAMLRQQPDGRLAVINENIAVTDPAANGEAVWRAYELTGDERFRESAERMLDYLLHTAPRTDNGAVCHNEVSFHEGFSPRQVWVDSIYMLPPFLAVMGRNDEALAQIESCMSYLRDDATGLLFHIYDAGSGRFVRRKLWATGNGWALMGIGRVIDTCLEAGRRDIADRLTEYGTGILDAMLKYQLPDGRFHDILDDEGSFVDGAGAMMMAAFVYRGVAGGWLDGEYAHCADVVLGTMEKYVDRFGIIHEVCGCPHFVDSGTSAESMAAYLMMHAHYRRMANRCSGETVRLFEELSFNSHPSLHTEHYDGWLLRYADGYTSRANSVSVIYPSSLDYQEKIEECERRYASGGLPCIFKITDGADERLDRLLEERGYGRFTPTDLMTMDITDRQFERCGCIITDRADEAWLDAYFALEGYTDDKTKATAARMLNMINADTLYCRIEHEGQSIACSSAVIERGYMALLNVVVDEQHRGMGWGRKLCRALLSAAVDKGAHTAYLQVVQSNTAAVKLYEKLGYRKLYSYWYRKK
ncbi:MAG: GNAT family N-acetyltransferase [Ruminococcaceae bacterium]|nr:GNAT family N-acetyltransferase [Oscillospiraceae bacterium]